MALAKTRGATMAVAVMQRPTYLHLLEHIGIDRAFSPRATAVNEIIRQVAINLDTGTLASCIPADANFSGNVEINEIIRSVNQNLDGCSG